MALKGGRQYLFVLLPDRVFLRDLPPAGPWTSLEAHDGKRWARLPTSQVKAELGSSDLEVDSVPQKPPHL